MARSLAAAKREETVSYFLVSDHGSDPLMAEVLNLKRMQSEPLIDPTAPAVTQAPDVADRVRRLAQAALDARNRVVTRGSGTAA